MYSQDRGLITKRTKAAIAGLDGSKERRIGTDVAVSHAWSVEGEPGVAVAIEKDKTASAVGAIGEQVNRLASSHHGVKVFAAGLGDRMIRRIFCG